jgi:hypothetical protein
VKVKHIRKSLKKASPTILTVVGAFGVVATAVLAVKATPKALEHIEQATDAKKADTGESLTKLEIAKSCWKCYIPAFITGTATIVCIFSANTLNRRQQTALTSAYALLDRSYKDYQRKLKELYGEEAHQKVLKALSEEKVDEKHTVYSVSMFAENTLDFGVSEEEHLFYDSFGDRHFTSTIGKVLQAEYHLNRNFALRGNASLNEFYMLLGIAPIEGGDDLGWWVDDNDEIYWVEFNHFVSQMDDGLDRPTVECLVIDYPKTPAIPPEDMLF